MQHRLNVNNDAEEETSDRKGAVTDRRKSDSRNEQTVGDWGPESVPRRDVGGERELLQVLPKRNVTIQHSELLQ